MTSHVLTTVVSGGQTGVDRAGLDAALDAGLGIGGWCPRGRRAEDGPIPECYSLRETASRNYTVRTEWNIRDSDGTLIVALNSLADGDLRASDSLFPDDDRLSDPGLLTGGSRLTWQLASRLQKPCHVVQLREFSNAHDISDQKSATEQCRAVVEWIRENRIRVLNIAGPRASSHPEVYRIARYFVASVLHLLQSPTAEDS